MSFPKPIFFIILAIAIPNYLWAQNGVQNLTFNSYFPVANLDSLEQVLLKTPKNTLAYTDLLLKYEHSHLLMHDVHSKYTTELIKLSKKETNPGRKAMFDLLFGWSMVSPEAESQIVSVNNALSHFEAVSDTAGMVNAYAILVWLNAGPSGAPESAMRSERYLDKMANLASNSTDLGVQIQHVFYKIGFSTKAQKTESFDQRMQQVQQAIRQIEAAPAYFPYLKLLLNVQGRLYSREGKYAPALQSYMRIYHQPNQESFSYLVNLCNFGNVYYNLGKIQIAKMFYQKAIAHADLNKSELLNPYRNAYYGLGKTLEKSNPIQAATYFQKAYEIGIKIQQFEDKKRFNDIQAILEQDQTEERFKTLSAEKLRIEEQNLQIKLLLGFALLLLLGIGVLALRFFSLSRRLKKISLSHDKVFSIIAHDLRSPLNAYMGLAADISFLLKKQQYGRIIAISKQIDTNAQSLNLLLNNLFQWSLTELEVIKPKWLSLDIIPDLKTTLNIYKSIAKNKLINIEIDLPEAHLITTDPNLLLTIIRNLLDNALKYCPTNGTVSVVLSSMSGKNHLTISNDISLDTPPDFITIRQLINQNKTFNYGEEGIGMGLLLIKEFAGVLKLPIQFIEMKNKACFTINLS